MGHPVLRLFDGSDSTSPELSGEVKELQTLLKADGFSLDVDGVFGPDTESALKRFQTEHGLADDGVVGPLTWSVLAGTRLFCKQPWPHTIAGREMCFARFKTAAISISILPVGTIRRMYGTEPAGFS